MSAPALLFYGDDFTGATDALATAARAGLRSVLLLAPPDDARLAAIGPLDCVGIAGAARSMPPAEMRDELGPIAALARRLGPRVLHYKACSTFDSAAHVGSIGEAVRALLPAVSDACVSIVGGQPNLGRYCLFGNLYAAAGADGEVFRIDRHPTMSRHPVTPMHEADLRRHLAQQGLDDIGLVPWTAYAGGDAAIAARLQALRAAGASAVLWDLSEAAQLPTLGRALWQQALQAPLLAVGPSSAIEAIAAALPGHAPVRPERLAPARGPVLVHAGSLSPVTARQVAAARSFEVVRVDAACLAERDSAYRGALALDVSARLSAGRHTMICTVPPGRDAQALPGRDLARAGGALLADVLRRARVGRLGIAGGDTSSHAVRALDAWGLSHAGAVAPGAPLCRLRSDDAALDGLELMLKGGQMGGDDVFERLIHGD
jgi:uncharacterized protein YgbK (DUF1537 family)